MVAIILVVGLWPGEKLRESLRKPYVAGRYVYSNQIVSRDVKGKGIKSEIDIVAKNGLLKVSPFVPQNLRTITPDNKLQAGELLAKMACSNCHSLEKDGKYRPLSKLFPMDNKEALVSYMKDVIGTGSIAYMPKIVLPDDEYDAIATWLVEQNK